MTDDITEYSASYKDMTLRDFFAAKADVPFDKVIELISMMKAEKIKTKNEEEGKEISYVELLHQITNDQTANNVTAKEITEMTALIRYQAADAMMEMREGNIPDWLKPNANKEITEDRWEAVANGE